MTKCLVFLSIPFIHPNEGFVRQVDIFNGLNNDILAREGLVALDMKHSVSPGPATPLATPLAHPGLRDNVTPGPGGQGQVTHIKQVAAEIQIFLSIIFEIVNII